MVSSRFATLGPTYDNVELRAITSNQDNQQNGYLTPPVAQSASKSRAKLKEIAGDAFFLVFPMLLLTCMLFAFVFGYLVDQSDGPFEQLRGNETSQFESNAYYVNLSSTLLIFLVSWMSSLAPMLITFATALAAYPIAGKLFKDTTQQNRARLMTPFQLTLALRMINGSTWSGIWNLLRYRLGWGKRVKDRGAALTSLFKVTIGVVFLSILVFAADTWLHIVTKTVSIVQVTQVAPEQASYGLALLSPNCTTTDNAFASQFEAELACTIDPGTGAIVDGTSAYQTLNNETNIFSAFNDGPDPALAYLAVNPARRTNHQDFSTTTFGLKTSCRSITQACNYTFNESRPYWNCSNGAFFQRYTGAVYGATSLQYAYFEDEDLANVIDSSTMTNPLYYTVSNVVSLPGNPTTNISQDPGVVADPGMIGVVLLCSLNFYEVDYNVVQGRVTQMTTTLANASVANVFMPAMLESSFAYPNFDNAFRTAAQMGRSAQDLADLYAQSYSKILLSVGAGSMVRIPATAAQIRDTILVAKVPKAPLFLLVVINLLFVLLGIVLATIALRSSPEAQEIHSRFTIAGIVAAMFETDSSPQSQTQKETRAAGGIEKLYDEYYEERAAKRIGLARGPDGNFAFTAMPKDLDLDYGVSSAWESDYDQGGPSSSTTQFTRSSYIQ